MAEDKRAFELPFVPVHEQDPFDHLTLVERALALALLVPRSPARAPIKVKHLELEPESVRRSVENAQKALGQHFAQLHNVMAQGPNPIPVLLSDYERRARGASRSQHTPFSLSVGMWGGTTRHHKCRMELIEALIWLRGQVIDRLRVVPEEPRRGRSEAGLSRLSSETSTVGWSDLNATEQDLMRLLGVRALQLKSLPGRVSKSLGMVRKSLAKLQKHGLVHHTPTGYAVCGLPIGNPSEVTITQAVPPAGSSPVAPP